MKSHQPCLDMLCGRARQCQNANATTCYKNYKSNFDTVIEDCDGEYIEVVSLLYRLRSCSKKPGFPISLPFPENLPDVTHSPKSQQDDASKGLQEAVEGLTGPSAELSTTGRATTPLLRPNEELGGI
ncbi:hypothetical protein J3459_016733 [Metarhizium acridum]|uniref:uncharacterized protein n=1 Tax=Metarhizium acridum TaxID=92637 RepID=UPI001C6B6995|nr:hypothetical protein J3459_016733 [Metarhizium acridum]KAG8413422.1 hypothetical protein J3458_012983 [Metarhizium acridum]